MLDTVLYFQGVEQFASSPSLFSFMSGQFLTPRTDKDSKEVYRLVSRSRLDCQREFATVISSPPGLLMCQKSISNIQSTETLSSFFETRHNPFVHLRNRTRNYFPKNDSSAAGVRWTELMFRRIRSLTEDVAFEENDWILISLLKTKNATQWGKVLRFW